MLCKEVGMDAYMSKPIRKEQLCDVICQVLLGRKKDGQVFLGTL
jgi:CheY-like chemotaxis protein